MSDYCKNHGAFCWNELLTTDLEAAKKFYGTLFGWNFVETKTIYGNTYLVAYKDETMVGGMMLKEGNVPDDVPTCWDSYITVDDVETSAKQIEGFGGTLILEPTDIPEVGRFCVIRDPQGACVNLITHNKQA